MIRARNRHGRALPVVIALVVIGVLVAGGLWWRSLNPGSAQDPANPTSARRVEKTEFAMGTVIRIVAIGDRAEDAVAAAMAEMHRLTDHFDRFDPEAELFVVNQSAENWVDVSPDTLALTQQAIQLARLAGGAFDPTVTPLIDLWGFVEVTDVSGKSGQSSGSPTPMRGVDVPSAEEIERTLAQVDYRAIEIDPVSSKLRLGLQGQQLDLGGIAKGYAADRAAEILKNYGIEHALVDTGGDIVALGTRDDGQPWRLGLRHPRENNIMAVIGVNDKAVATSGDYERYFEVDGVRYSHIIDPKTGWPASELMSVTVVAPSGVQADALATAVFVLGPDEGTKLIESLPDVEAIMVSVDGDTHVTSGLDVEFL